MNIKEHSSPDKLERYSFIWSELRLLIAAVALIIGGYPVLIYFLPFSSLYGIASLILKVCWIISGLSSGYLFYRWFKNDKKIFGHANQTDMIAFLVSVISGLNLGITGLTGNNIGMSIFSSDIFLFIAGLIYVATAIYLFTRWKTVEQKIF